MTQQIFIGENTPEKLKSLFQNNNWYSSLLVTGKKSFETSGSELFITETLTDLNLETVRFYDFDNNPNIIDLKKGLSFSREHSPDVIIAIGGGSVLDMGKLLRFFLTHEGTIFGGIYTQVNKKIPLITIPTTAGTGAEATHFAVLYDEKGEKHSIEDTTILPDFAVINPKLTNNSSPYVTACSGFDALAQAIEAYWNKNATQESDEYAIKAINLIYDTLPEVVSNPTPFLRNKMAEGALWAGKAINITKTTAPHAFSYPFTAHYGIPHGHAVSMIFPKIAELNISEGHLSDIKKQKLLSFFGMGAKVEDTIKNYINRIGLEVPLYEYDLGKIIAGINLERLANNPAEISKEKAISIIKSIIYDD